MRINKKILNILEDRKANWVSLLNKYNLMTKQQVTQDFITRIEGKDKNLIQERNKILQEKTIEQKQKKSISTPSGNIFKGLKKSNDEDDEES